MRTTRAWAYASRILVSAPLPVTDALAREFARRPAFVRVINAHVNREIRRREKSAKALHR